MCTRSQAWSQVSQHRSQTEGVAAKLASSHSPGAATNHDLEAIACTSMLVNFDESRWVSKQYLGPGSLGDLTAAAVAASIARKAHTRCSQHSHRPCHETRSKVIADRRGGLTHTGAHIGHGAMAMDMQEVQAAVQSHSYCRSGPCACSSP